VTDAQDTMLWALYDVKQLACIMKSMTMVVSGLDLRKNRYRQTDADSHPAYITMTRIHKQNMSKYTRPQLFYLS
jgi:hypothetical protein